MNLHTSEAGGLVEARQMFLVPGDPIEGFRENDVEAPGRECFGQLHEPRSCPAYRAADAAVREPGDDDPAEAASVPLGFSKLVVDRHRVLHVGRVVCVERNAAGAFDARMLGHSPLSRAV